MTSCSEKFEVTAPYKDVTVVYGFLDIADTAHYIRIQKAFLDENKSAVSMAQSSDSNFFNNINVRVERYRAAGVNGVHAYVDSIHLRRVDMAQEGYTKQPGTFFTSPNYAYKFTDPLDPQYIYRLKIVHFNTGNVDSADAPVINNIPPTLQVPILTNSALNIAGMSFYSVIAKRYFDFDGTYQPLVGYSYNGESTPVRITQSFITFNWHDSDINTKAHTPRSYDMDAGYQPVDKNSFSYQLSNNSLHSAMALGMGAAPDNIVRLLDRSRITVYLSTTDYANYRNALLIQGNGLTGSEISPVYTNIKGKDVLGLFTSRASISGLVTIDKRTVDSLMVNPLLTSAKIRGTVYR
ncbi:hypothetical protein GCM10023093_29160 [Nemorincola caseinilytica]|uniref:DUF4270 family protein n=1 Tax=Nemorincola caseinilytica TaxID=2054315 RepID=A0ABP8NLZ6_9BACT